MKMAGPYAEGLMRRPQLLEMSSLDLTRSFPRDDGGEAVSSSRKAELITECLQCHNTAQGKMVSTPAGQCHLIAAGEQPCTRESSVARRRSLGFSGSQSCHSRKELKPVLAVTASTNVRSRSGITNS